jgi:small neutral amino acid transporter SnatA (MarC family)
MLKELLYEMLMKATNFVIGVFVADDLFDIEQRRSGRVLVKIAKGIEKILNVLWKIAWISFMISMTGGLYLIWIGFKLMRKHNKRKHNKKQTKRRA